MLDILNKSKLHLSTIAVFALLMFVSVTAQAALPDVIATSISELETDVVALMDLVWPFVLTVLGIFVLLRLTKRGVRAV